ncbi:7243_t:CDS:2 [Ambispora gerdemannii]|uniref:7243_t:CDS:1 n=1 Tax=Ambispora gerdemannii TaxID=144530 RepID=A0A9N8YTV0_9GLOM|nr:7243_t:CDS:2 [Ambispora gerdemannii]
MDTLINTELRGVDKSSRSHSPPPHFAIRPNKRTRITLPSFKRLWTRKLASSVNCLIVGALPSERSSKAVIKETSHIIVGTNEGKIFMFGEDKEGIMMETKSGPIQSIVLCDITGFGIPDIIVGDSYGSVMIFEKQQLVVKRELGAAVKHMTMFRDAVNGHELVIGDSAGVLSALTLYQDGMSFDPSIRCMLHVTLLDQFQIPTKFLLVCDRSPYVHLIQSGIRTLSIIVPSSSIANAMCSGYFRRKDIFDPEVVNIRYDMPSAVQVVLGCEDGNIYIMEDYTIHNMLKMDNPITDVKRFRPHNLESTETDFLVCIGHFNEVRIFKDCEPLRSIITDDLVSAIDIGDANNDGRPELIIGMLNNTIEVYGYDDENDA